MGVCLMHLQREPQTMQAAPDYGDVVAEAPAASDNTMGVLAL